ncbi:hypothetical protein K402DRAFT_398431 [Aulographum hederae CBS 113979]|uniref:Zn(2)-C6 fungal-type domain-containing protein n=1 Tax=Aulographum hederae CBS 113979 TaxID=1176131 RepID=A0A6G1GLG3_9PEZI|nr:hypothetical protein K402DRAFT_398431 [Aulographum hederae CBS 113979]
MYEELAQPVLRCTQCNKPFDKESTLKRHGYYCRSRNSGVPTRARSCMACAKVKSRCDTKRPGCSRCVTKGIACQYPAASRPRNIPNSLAEPEKTESSLIADPSGVDQPESLHNDGQVLFDDAISSEPDFANIGGDFLNFDIPDIDFGDLLNPETNFGVAEGSPSSPSSLVRHSVALTGQTGPMRFESIPPVPSSTIRMLIERPKPNSGPQRISDIIFHTLKSYPLMMLQHDTLPPFIHPQMTSLDVGDTDIEPLTNCINLVRMISSGARGSRKLFWKNVRMECEHLRHEHSILNDWEAFTAMQALCIYTLIRLDEGETEYNNFDYLLITTIAAMSIRLGKSDIVCTRKSSPHNSGLGMAWKDWIFEESRRRLGVIYRVVNMLVYFDPTSLCELQTDLVLAPLPTRKQLWEAGDEMTWELESQRIPDAHTSFALTASGDLVKLEASEIKCRDGSQPLTYKFLDPRTREGSSGVWEEWCSGMDAMGGLVMLVSSLVG